MSQSHGKNENLIQRPPWAKSDRAITATSRKPESASLPRSLSLKNRESIARLFKSAKRRSSPSLTVFYRIYNNSTAGCAPQSNPAKWLVAIPKRTGNAVRRNRLRRALRETIRLWSKRGHIRGEVIVRYNAPRKTGKSDAQVNSCLTADKQKIAKLQSELVELLERICSDVVND